MLWIFVFHDSRTKLTLNDPKFLTEHAIRTFLPAGTVTFSMISVNSGSSATASKSVERKKAKEFHY